MVLSEDCAYSDDVVDSNVRATSPRRLMDLMWEFMVLKSLMLKSLMMGRRTRLRHDIVYNAPMDIGESEITPAIMKSQLFMI